MAISSEGQSGLSGRDHDGQLHANLMMDFDVGVSVSASYIVKETLNKVQTL